MPLPTLAEAAVGAPITRLGISFYPIYLASDGLPEIATGAKAGLVLDELDQASVPTLLAHNPTETPILIVEGEHFHGGKQNRSIHVTMLIPAQAKLEIPVSCLEAGRWGRKRAYRRDAAFAPRRVRNMGVRQVAQSMRVSGDRRGSQRAVWDAVNRNLAENRVASATAAAADVEGAYAQDVAWSETVRELADSGPLPGQCGIAVTHGRHVVAVELFGSPNLLAPHWNGLVRSYLLERPVAKGAPSAQSVLSFIRRFAFNKSEDSPGVGLGIERRVENESMAGQALTLEGKTVHASFFANL